MRARGYLDQVVQWLFPELDLRCAPEQLVCCAGLSRRLVLIKYLQQLCKDSGGDSQPTTDGEHPDTTATIALRLAADAVVVAAMSKAIVTKHGGVEAVEATMLVLVAGPAADSEFASTLRNVLVEHCRCIWMDAAVRCYTTLFSLATVVSNQLSEEDQRVRNKFEGFFAYHASRAIRSAAVVAAAVVSPLFLGFPLPQVAASANTRPSRTASQLFS